MYHVIRTILFVLIFFTALVNGKAQHHTRPTIKASGNFTVNSYTGNMYYERTDLHLPGRLPLDITFSYNSSNRSRNWGMGRGWTFTYNMAYGTDSLGVIIERADGQKDLFIKNGTKYIPPVGVYDSLSEYQPGKFVLVEKGGTKYFFGNNIHKKLTKLQDRMGNAIDLTYTDTLLTALTDAAGRTCAFAWTNGRLTQITDRAGLPERKISYDYDTLGNPVKVTNPLNHSIRYFYDRSSKITGMTDERGNNISIVYNANAAVAKIVSCLTEQTFAYVLSQLKTYVTEEVNGQKQITSYRYDTLGRIIHKQGNCCGFNEAYAYDGNNNVTSIKNGNNRETKYEYDGRGNVTKVTDPLGYSITYTYETEYNQVKSMKDKRGNISTYDYDGKGNLVKITRPLGVVEEYSYNDKGDLLSHTDGNGNTTSFTYSSNGYLEEILDAESGITSFEYDIRGNLITLTDPEKFATAFKYDEVNRLTTITNALGYATVFDYDAANNLKSVTNAKNKKTVYEYDGLNRLVKVKTPLNITSETRYDEKGNAIKVIDGNGNVMVFTYNSRNQVVSATDAKGNNQNFTYDEAGNRTGATDENGNTTRYEYDASGQLIKTTNAMAGITAFEYDPNGNLVSAKDAGGNTTTYRYDELNRLSTITDALGKPVTYDYDKNGNVLIMTDRRSYATEFGYDRLNRLKKRTDALNGIEEFAYDKNGNLVTAINAMKFVTLKRYDAVGKLISIVNPSGDSMTYHYDEVGKMDRATAPGGNVTSFFYDDDGRVREIADKIGLITRYTYDNNGNVSSETDASDNTTSYVYDVVNRPVTVKFANNATQHFLYDKKGNTIRETNQKGFKTLYEYDLLDRLVKITDPMGYLTRFTYDANSNKTSLVDAKGNITSYQYDALSRLSRQVFPDGSSKSFTYDPNGNPLTRTDNNGAQTRYEYDRLNRLTGRFYPGNGSDQYGYDAAGRMKTAVNAYAAVRFDYDAAGRLSKEDVNGRVITYAYNIANRTRNIIYPGGMQLVQKMDIRNRLSVIEEGGSALVSFQYDGANNLSSKQYRNNTSANYLYDKVHNLASINVSPGNLMQLNYLYDSANSRVRMERVHKPGFSEQYGYDSLLQVKNFSLGTYQDGAFIATKEHQYNYDALGNRTTVREDTIMQTYISNNLNQYKSITVDGRNITPAYDKNGNILTDGINSYTYDGGNRLVLLENNNTEIHYQYDALGRRISKSGNGKEITFFYDGPNLVEEKENGTIKSYVYGSGADQIIYSKTGASSNFYNTDALNSVQSITAADGSIAESYLYEPFGYPHIFSASNAELESSQINTIFFKGRSYDFGSYTYDYRNREMNPLVGRFINRDPIGFLDGVNVYANSQPHTANGFGNNFAFKGRELVQDVGLYDIASRMHTQDAGRFLEAGSVSMNTGDVNLYRYTGNNPANRIDPLGLDWDDWVNRADNLLQSSSDFSAGAADNLTAHWGLLAFAANPGPRLAQLVYSGNSIDDLLYEITTPWTQQVRQKLGYNDIVDKCGRMYNAGEWFGTALSVAQGIANGLKAAGKAVKGVTNFSHFIPERYIRPTFRSGLPNPEYKRWLDNRLGRWLIKGHNKLNGNHVTKARHYFHDDYSYFKGWQNLGHKWHPALQIWDRVPYTIKEPASEIVRMIMANEIINRLSPKSANKCDCK